MNSQPPRIGGEPERSAASSYECGICWAVYDPALGDDYAQVAPGTAFEALPVSWHCPNCDAPKARFMAVVP